MPYYNIYYAAYYMLHKLTIYVNGNFERRSINLNIIIENNDVVDTRACRSIVDVQLIVILA